MDNWWLPEQKKESFMNSKMLSFDKLIDAIEDLEKQGVITFEEFKKLSYLDIRNQYFCMVHEKQIAKAKIKIQDMKDGKKGPSTYITISSVYQDGKLIRQNTKHEEF